MLHPHIRAWIVHAKSVGIVTSIVSNGTGIDREFLEAMSEHLDWVGLSIDASNDILQSVPYSDSVSLLQVHEFGVGVAH